MDNLTKRKISQYFLLHHTDYEIDDITYNDLNFDDVFECINKTSSSLGEEVLYSILRQPLMDMSKLNEREVEIQKYIDNPKETRKIIKELKDLSKLKKVSVFEYLQHIGNVEKISLFQKILATLFILLSVGLLFVNTTIGIIVLAVAYSFNLVRYFKLRDKIVPYLISVSYLSKAVAIGDRIPNINRERYSKIHFLKNGAFLIGNVNGATVNNGNGNPFDIIIDFLKMGFHFDIIRFYSLSKKIASNYQDIDDYLAELGYMDAYISIGEYRKTLSYYSLPDLNEELDRMIINEVYHPLLNNPVANSIEVSDSILLTGANASGKSTFLRAVAINTIFAQTIHTCPCREYKAPFFKVISSMSLTDSISKNESFYVAEVKAVKRIIDLADSSDNMKVLCFIDEVLRGTNTKERIASSTSILRYLNDKCICFGATHDIELTYLLEDKYKNYHFDEQVCSDDISFSYKIKQGRASSTNAIKLLKVMNFPKEITENADLLADNGS